MASRQRERAIIVLQEGGTETVAAGRARRDTTLDRDRANEREGEGRARHFR